MKMTVPNDDYIKFCMKCSWNDCDFGCSSPPYEEVYQCPMYMHYHPKEVEAFEKSMEEWVRSMKQQESEVDDAK